MYSIQRALRADDGGFLPEAQVVVTPFSMMVEGAKDLVSVRLGSYVEASFVVGEQELTVAYGRLGAHAPAALIASVEEHLTAYLQRT